MASEEIKNQLESITTQLQQVKGSIATCDQFVADEIVAIVSGKEVAEGEKPLSLTITSAALIEAAMAPIKNTLNARKENLLAAKEAVLKNLENELTGGEEVKDPEPEKETVE